MTSSRRAWQALLSRSETSSDSSLTTATSGRPSRLKSPTTAAAGSQPRHHGLRRIEAASRPAAEDAEPGRHGQEVRPAVQVDVGRGHELEQVRRVEADRGRRLEHAADVAVDVHAVAAERRDGEVDRAVRVEVPGREGERVAVGAGEGERLRHREAAAGVRQDLDVVGPFVAHREVEVAVAVEVGGDDGRRLVGHRDG